MYRIVRIGVFCVHKPGFLMPGHIIALHYICFIEINMNVLCMYDALV